MNNNNPIGILDSGLGGLTVWKEIKALLPLEATVYIADSKNTPYGKRSADEIYHLAKNMIDFLISKQVKMVVIACNTITVSCLEKLRSDYPDLPIVGTVPVVKTAAAVTKNKRIGILSTTRTAESDYQKQLITTFADHCEVFVHGTDELVPLVEAGELTGTNVEAALQKVLGQFQEEDVDTIALGCTHFPFLREEMQKILGDKVAILESGPAIARQVRRVLEHKQILSENLQTELSFYTTGNPTIAKKLLAATIAEEKEFKRIKLSS